MTIITYLTALDLGRSAQTIGCAIGELAYTTARDFYYGRKCAADNLRKLKLANAYLRIIEEYISIADDETSTVNCLSEEDMQGVIFPSVSALLNVTLPNPGTVITTEIVDTTLGDTRITELGDMRITDGSDPRIIE